MSDTTASDPATGNPDGSPPAQRPARGRRLTIMTVASTVLLAAASATYLLAGLSANDRMPRNATVDGASVDGLSRDEAARIARAGASVRLDQAVRLSGPDGWSTTIVPARAGFTLDTDGAIDGVEAPGWSPSGLWRWLTVPTHVTSAMEIDRERLSEVVAERTAGLAAAPREPAIRPARRDLVLDPGSTGWTLDVAAASQAVIAAVESGSRDVVLAARAVPPAVCHSSEVVSLTSSSTGTSSAHGVNVDKGGAGFALPGGAGGVQKCGFVRGSRWARNPMVAPFQFRPATNQVAQGLPTGGPCPISPRFSSPSRRGLLTGLLTMDGSRRARPRVASPGVV